MSVSIPATNATDNRGTGSSAVVNIAGVAATGDLIVVHLFSLNANSAVSPPAGWTYVGKFNFSYFGTTLYLTVLKRIRQGGDGATVTVTLTGSADWWGLMVGFRSTVGFDASSLYNFTTTGKNNDTTVTCPTVAAILTGELALAGAGCYASDLVGLTISGGWTYLQQYDGPTAGQITQAAWRSGTAGPPATVTFTMGSNGTNRVLMSYSLIVRDAATAVPAKGLFFGTNF